MSCRWLLRRSAVLGRNHGANTVTRARITMIALGIVTGVGDEVGETNVAQCLGQYRSELIDVRPRAATRLVSQNEMILRIADHAQLGKPFLTAPGVLSKPNTRSATLGAELLNADLNETITIDVTVVAKYGWVASSTTSGGSGSWTGTPNQLRSGVTIDLNGAGFTNKATFSITGIPTEPKLPAWTRR